MNNLTMKIHFLVLYGYLHECMNNKNKFRASKAAKNNLSSLCDNSITKRTYSEFYEKNTLNEGA
ncbi:MAG TPA: hypothetical protein DEV59_13900 [Proteus sp.]|nr:hypothetical protein [Proteus sp. (in: enterobacteria)]